MGEKKKVLFLIHTLQIGGAERILVDTVNHLSKDKYDITVMTVIDFGSLKKELKDHIHYKTLIKTDKIKKILSKKSGNNIDQSIGTKNKDGIIKRFAISLYSNFWKYTNLKKFYKKHIKEQYDVEISFLEGIPAKIIANSSNEKSKKICWIHIDLLNEAKSDKFFKSDSDARKIYDMFDDIVCVSEHVKESFDKKYGITGKARVIYNPIDSEKIIALSNESVDIKKDKLTLCTVGRLSHQKGYDRLINVVHKLNANNYDFNVWIIGVGSEEEELKKQCDDLGVKNISFLGYKKNPYPYMKKSDIFVCSSRAEGFSTVVAESIVLNKTILSTDCSGAKEMLGCNSEYGIVCDNNENALYESLENILKNPERTIKKYEKNIKERSKIFNINKVIEDIEAII